jgi:hypothetical protein
MAAAVEILSGELFGAALRDIWDSAVLDFGCCCLVSIFAMLQTLLVGGQCSPQDRNSISTHVHLERIIDISELGGLGL